MSIFLDNGLIGKNYSNDQIIIIMYTFMLYCENVKCVYYIMCPILKETHLLWAYFHTENV